MKLVAAPADSDQLGSNIMKNELPNELTEIINHRCSKYKAREVERKEAIAKLDMSIDMTKVEKWRRIEDHQHKVDQDDIDLGFA